MLATWWDHNMHGRRLVGHVAGLFAVVLAYLIIAATPRLSQSLTPLSAFCVTVGFILGGSVEYRKKHEASVLRRVVITVASVGLGLVLVLTSESWLRPLLRTFPAIAEAVPLLALTCLALIALSVTLTEDDIGERRWSLLGLGALVAVFGGALVAISGSPLALIGLVVLLLGAAVLAGMLVLRDWVLDQLG